MDDRELLDRLRQGDHNAFDSIFRAYYAPLVGFADKMLHQRGAGEELVQDVMLELWRRRETLVVDDSLRAYLYRATRNRALNEVRHERVKRRGEPYAVTESAIGPAVHAELEEEELDVAIRKAVTELPDAAREVFELSRVHGLKYSEIASALGVSIKTVEARMGKALRELRGRLAKWLPERSDI